MMPDDDHNSELHYPEVGVQPWRYRRQALHVRHPGGLGVYGREGGAARAQCMWPLAFDEVRV